MVKILFFAQLREYLNCQELEWPLQQSTTVAELLMQLRAQGDRWQEGLPAEKVLAAVNQTMSGPDADIHPGDEVAFFPPVTGG